MDVRSIIVKYAVGIVLFVVSFWSQARNVLITDISQEQGQWFVEYTSHVPIKSIQFPFSPDKSRLKRWQILDEQFTFLSSGSSDTVIRKDSRTFKKVKFKLTPTYIHLPKAYAPFSPFSDGGLLLHTARFFACSELCSVFDNQWYLSISIDTTDNIYHGSKLYKSKVGWWDKNDGSKVYIGPQNLVHEPSYTSIIDRGLPENIQHALSKTLPQMMSMLALRYGELSEKPVLYASFGQTQGAHFGRQGGVLPKQVFMHWYGKLPEKNLKQERELLWFFAHEVAHLYQGNLGGGLPEHLAWLHEGHAEYIAMELLREFLPDANTYAEQVLKSALQSCGQYHQEENIFSSLDQVDYRLFYQCGLLAYDLIAKANHHQGSYKSTIDTLWLGLIKASAQDGFDAQKVFFEHVKAILTAEQYRELTQLIGIRGC